MEGMDRRNFLHGIKNFAIGAAASGAFPITEARGARSVDAGKIRQPGAMPQLDIKPEQGDVIESFLKSLALEFEKNPGISAWDFMARRGEDFNRVAQPYIIEYVHTFGTIQEADKMLTPLGIQNRALGLALAFALKDPNLDERVKECLFMYWNSVAEQLERLTLFQEGNRASVPDDTSSKKAS